jgi:beta-phosphoglucomutase
MNNLVTALLFDLDGTLFDSTQANVVAYTKAFADAGVTFDEAKYRKLFGLRFDEMVDAIAPDTNKEKRATIKSRKAVHYKENMQLITANDGLLALLKSVRATHKIALVTTASRANVESLLTFFHYSANLFDTIITGEDVTNGKPDPECYTIAMQRLNVSADQCCIFEDSEVGIKAALGAGARVIQVHM